MNITIPQIKNLAKKLQKEHPLDKSGRKLAYSSFLETIAQGFGYKDYNSFVALFGISVTRNVYTGATRTGKTEHLLRDIMSLMFLSKQDQQKIMVFCLKNEEYRYREIIPYANYDVAALLDWDSQSFLLERNGYPESSKEEKQKEMAKNPRDLDEALDRAVDVIIIDGKLEGIEDGLEKIYHKGISFFPEKLKKTDFYIATQREDIVDYIIEMENNDNHFTVSIKEPRTRILV